MFRFPARAVCDCSKASQRAVVSAAARHSSSMSAETPSTGRRIRAVRESAHHHNLGGASGNDHSSINRDYSTQTKSTNTIKLVLMRHGQSKWNADMRFTGWADIGLTTEGEDQAARAGAALNAMGFEFDCVFTSMLKRSVRSAWIMLGEAQMHWVPVTPTWALNERHYGALTGMSKPEATERLGHDMVMSWRRSWTAAPPPIEADHPLFGRLVDRRYASALKDDEVSVLPSTESLEQCSQRVVSFWNSTVVPALRAGDRPLIVAHAHTIRALIKHIDHISNTDIEELTIPTGTPLVYSLDRDTLEPVRRRAMADHQTSHEELLSAFPRTDAESEGLGFCVESSAVVSPHTISQTSLDARIQHIEGMPFKPIKICNKTWRVVSGPGVIEECELHNEFRRLGEKQEM